MVVRRGLREISYENKEQLSAVLARGQSLVQQKYMSSPSRPSRATESCDVVFKKFLVSLEFLLLFFQEKRRQEIYL